MRPNPSPNLTHAEPDPGQRAGARAPRARRRTWRQHPVRRERAGSPGARQAARRMRWSACRFSSEPRSRYTLCRALQKKKHTHNVCSRYALPEGSAVIDAVGGEGGAHRCAPPPVCQQAPGVARAATLAPAPQIYGELRRRIIATQPADRQAHLAACLDKLMADVQRTLEPKNRDKFTQARRPGRAFPCTGQYRCLVRLLIGVGCSLAEPPRKHQRAPQLGLLVYWPNVCERACLLRGKQALCSDTCNKPCRVPSRGAVHSALKRRGMRTSRAHPIASEVTANTAGGPDPVPGGAAQNLTVVRHEFRTKV